MDNFSIFTYKKIFNVIKYIQIFTGEGFMYSVGDIIVYGCEGVCKIDRIDKINISGLNNNKLYYYLIPLFRNGMIYAPTDTPVKMRNVISEKEALELIDRIPELQADVCNEKNIRVLNDYYQSVIKRCDCEELVKIIKAIETKRASAASRGKHLGTVDERYLNKAREMLLDELAVSLNRDKNEIDRFIRDKAKN